MFWTSFLGTLVRKCSNKFGVSLTYSYLCPHEQDIDEEISYKDDEGKWHTEIVEKALHGTYVANSSVIRIVSDEFDGKERVLLWAIDSLSTKQIVVEYNFSMNGGNLLAIVTLDRI